MDSNVTFFESGLQLVRGQGNLKSALGNMLPIVAQLANSAGASLFLTDEKEQVLKPLVTFGLPESYVKLCGAVPIGEQCCGRAVQQRKVWIVSDMLSDPLFSSARGAAMETSIRAAFSVPVIRDDGKCLGSLACHYKRPYTPTKENIDVNRTWAALIAHTLSQYEGTQLDLTSDVIPAATAGFSRK
jgi:GAF domain-containing protein